MKISVSLIFSMLSFHAVHHR